MICDPLATVDAGDSLPLELRFYAEGSGQTPTAVTYTLRDSDGEIINERSAVPLSPTAEVMYLFLDGADLPNTGTTAVPIYLYVQFTYTSSIDGNPHSPIDKYTIYVRPIP